MTPEPWKYDSGTGTILAAAPVHKEDNSIEIGYGGYLIAETVALCNGPVLAAAPALLRAAKKVRDDWNAGRLLSSAMQGLFDAIASSEMSAEMQGLFDARA